ncbi:MAG: DUF7340 domain-containing protein [Aquihabitans sp.]
MTQPDPVTIDEIGNLVRLLAMTTRDDTRPHPASNLVTPSLLQQLRANIVPDGDGGYGGRSKAANERIPLNAAALSLYDFLDRKIKQQFESGTERVPIGSPEELLVAWYVQLAIDVAGGDVRQAQLDALYARLDDWRTRIMDLFNPPERGDIPHACPECGWLTIFRDTSEGTVRQYALVEIVRPWRDEEGVRCRNCGTTWTGDGDVKELAADLGIDLTIQHDANPDPLPAPPETLYLAAMTRDQANEFARGRGVDPQRDIVLAGRGAVPRIRGTERPIVYVTHDGYAPGRHELTRVREAHRIARLVNGMNGFDADGNRTTTEETTES